MKNSTKVEFHDKSLKQILDKYSSNVEEYLKPINECSSDIRAVEESLRNLNIQKRYEYVIKDPILKGSDCWESLSWSLYPQEGRYRLLFEFFPYDPEDKEDVDLSNEVVKPLIEMDSSTRLRFYQEGMLREFMEKFFLEFSTSKLS